MAACRRVLHGLRHVQLVVRTNVGLVQRNVSAPSGCSVAAAAGEAEVGSSSSSSSSFLYSAWRWQEERLGFARDAPGWSSWRHLLASRGLHETAWRGENEDEKRSEGGESRGESGGARANKTGDGDAVNASAKVANDEARNLVQHVHLASLKKRLRNDSRDTISYEELLGLCQTVGLACDKEDAARMAHAFNDAGVVITFRDKVHLHPEKVSEC